MSWNKAELNSICDVFTDGDWIESKDQSENGIRLIQTGNVGFGKFKARDSKARYVSEETFKRLRCTEIKQGDILVSRLPDPVGRACVIPELDVKSITAVDCTIIRTKKEIISTKFLNYFCQSPQYFQQVNKNITGATRQRISRILLGKTEIPLPTLDTQQKIVDKLDAIFAEIDKATAAAEANAKNAESLFQSYLTQVFEIGGKEWQTNQLGKITKFIDYRGKTPTKTDSGIRLITAKNVKFGYLNKEPYEYIAEEDYVGWMTRGIPEKGDVLFTTEAPLANVAQLDTDEKVVFAQRLIILQTKKEVLDSEFLKFLLLSRKVQNEIISKGTGATVKGIKASLLKLIPIDFPSLNEQRKICSKLSILESESKKVKLFYLSKVSNLSMYKKSILKKAFAGELIKE